MDILNTLDVLSKKARLEQTPLFHVSESVMKRIQPALIQDDWNWFRIVGGFSIVAASIVFWLGINAWNTLSSPLTSYIAPIQGFSW